MNTFKNTKGSGKRIGNVSDNYVAKKLNIPINTLRKWRESRPALYFFLKAFTKEELDSHFAAGERIRDDERKQGKTIKKEQL